MEDKDFAEEALRRLKSAAVNPNLCPKCGADIKTEFQSKWYRKIYCPKCDYEHTEYIGPMDGGPIGPDKIDWA